MLADRDRIFTNLYGFHDAGLKAALKRETGMAPNRFSRWAVTGLSTR